MKENMIVKEIKKSIVEYCNKHNQVVSVQDVHMIDEFDYGYTAFKVMKDNKLVNMFEVSAIDKETFIEDGYSEDDVLCVVDDNYYLMSY